MTRNPYDEQEFSAFVMDESRIKTDDSEPDEHSTEAVFGFDDESIHPYYSNADLLNEDFQY